MGYSREIYLLARKNLQQRKENMAAVMQSREEEIARKIPQIKELDIELRRLVGDALRLAASGKGGIKAATAVCAEGEKVALEKVQLLAEHGYPADYLSQTSACPACGDSGYIGDKMCPCFERDLKQIAYDELNMVAPSKLSSFGGFDLRFYSDAPQNNNEIVPRTHMKKIFDFAKEYAKTFSLSSKNLVMQGKTGLGKTHLSLSIAKEVLDKGWGVVYVSANNLFAKAEKERFQNGSEQGYVDSVIACDLLILDDLGTEFKTQFTVSVLYNIINTRQNEGRPTIVSTNLSPEELYEEYSDRIISRLLGASQLLIFLGSDIRQMKSR